MPGRAGAAGRARAVRFALPLMLLAAAALAPGLYPSRAAAQSPASPASLAQRAAALADAVSLDWSHSLNRAGAIVDPLTGFVEGGYGRTFLAYGMLRATQRDPALALVPVAARALEGSDGVDQAPFNLLGLAEALIDSGGALGAGPTETIAASVLSDPPFGIPARTAPCFQRAGCYDNLKLVDATAVLATLAALPGRIGPLGSTFAVPAAAARRAARLLSVTVPRMQVAGARLQLGAVRLAGATLSDPTSDPPAYLALSAMMLGRSLELSSPRPPAAVRAFQRAIVALLGLAGPDGDVSYMGRGQGQVWTMASAAAACALAMRLLAGERPLASRCEGLLDTELRALAVRRRLGGTGIATVPRLSWTRGVDRYANPTDYDGLCVYALNLAADAVAGLADPGELAPPGAVEGERFVDSGGSGLATADRGGLWFAVHRRSASPRDSRWGFGLMALERLRAGVWRSALTGRPLGPGAQGPLLVVGRHVYAPRGRSIRVEPGAIVIRGGWYEGRRLVRPASFRYEATSRGVLLRVPVARGEKLIVREWTLPGAPGTLSVLAPLDRQAASRVSLRLGNADSDSLDQISHSVRVRRRGVVRLLWAA
jgi:hypothetical protein